MLSRDAAHRIDRFLSAVTSARRTRIAAQLLLAAGFGYVLVRFDEIWRSSTIELSHVRWAYLVAAASVSGVAVAWSGFVWLAILARLNARVSPVWVGIFFQSQLAKYVPGSIWQYAGRTALARAAGLPLRAVAVSLPVELGASVCAAAAFAVLFVGWWGVLGLLLLAPILGYAGSRLRSGGVAGAGIRAVQLDFVIWALMGAGFWLTARAFVHAPAVDLPRYTATFALAWLAGLAAVYAPGGLGVREAVIVGLLRGKVGTADALVVAAASRLVLILVDTAAAGASVIVLRRAGAALPRDVPDVS